MLNKHCQNARGTTDPEIDSVTCISCKFDHKMAPLALLSNSRGMPQIPQMKIGTNANQEECHKYKSRGMPQMQIKRNTTN